MLGQLLVVPGNFRPDYNLFGVGCCFAYEE